MGFRSALGGALWIGFHPPTSCQPLAWVALAPFFLAQRSLRLGGALLLAWVWSILAAYATGDWMPEAVSTNFLQPKIVGAAFFLGIATTTAAPYWIHYPFDVPLIFMSMCIARFHEWSGARSSCDRRPHHSARTFECSRCRFAQ